MKRLENQERYTKPTMVALAIGAFVLSGCRDSQRQADGVYPCQPHSTKDSRPLKDPEKASAKLLRGVEILRTRIMRDTIVSSDRVAGSDYMFAIQAVYVRQENGYYNLSESKVDDPSEMLCYDEKSDAEFFTPAAREAIHELRAVGIDVSEIDVR